MEMMPDQCNSRLPRDTKGNALVADAIYMLSVRGGGDSVVKVFEADCELYCQACRLDGTPMRDSRPQRIDSINRACRWARV